jgi:hypothetical protein
LAFQGTKNDAHLVFMTFMQMMTFLYWMSDDSFS